MNFDAYPPYQHSLANGFTLRSVATREDAERLVAFNGHIFGVGVATMTRALMFHHPNSRPDYWLFIEDETQILSSLVLIPWAWRYEDVTLKAGEMGIVGTHESARNQGLIRALDSHFKELLHADQFHLSIIQGIPYFYRQFGYEYALPLEAQWRIELRHLTMMPDPAIQFRRATLHDIPTLIRFEEIGTRALQIASVRTADIWHYLLSHVDDTATATETWLLETEDQPVGYCRIPLEGFGEGLIVSEAVSADSQSANTLLSWLKTMAISRAKPYLRFNLAATNEVLRIAQGYGAYDAGGYQWQIHIVDTARLLRQLTPVLERRLAASPFARLSQTVNLNLYRSGVALHFDQGRLRGVETVPMPPDSEINIPPHLLAPLLLGFRTPEALSAFYPDFRVFGQSRVLMEILFPSMSAFVQTIY